MDKAGTTVVKLIVFLTFIVMVAVNFLANYLPINGITTGAVSDFYENLFTPASFTFAIWGLIYLLLTAYTLYMIGLFSGRSSIANKKLIKRIGILFSITSLANAAWIFFWHYDYIALSMLMMVIMLNCLILINNLIKRVYLTNRDKIFIQLPFSIYFGWITVATVANFTVLLVSLGWDGFGLSEVLWTIIILGIVALIGVAVSLINKDIAYAAVLIWAYIGIVARHISPKGYSWQYPGVVITAAVCIVLLGVILVYIATKKKQVSDG